MDDDLLEDAWVRTETVSGTLRATARRYPDRDAFVFPAQGIRWSWREFDERVDRLASGFLALGVQKGDHVGIWSMNGPEWVAVQFACARFGGVLVNINPSYRVHELEAALFAADVAALVVGRPFKTSNFVEMVESLLAPAAGRGPGAVVSERLPRLRRLITLEPQAHGAWTRYAEIADAAVAPGLAAIEAGILPDDVHNIQFTSGTTGLPKGAMLTHTNVLMNAYCVGRRLNYAELDRVCVPVPFYHCFGCVLGTMVCAVFGSACVSPSANFDAEAALAAIDREKCTSVYGVPTMFVAELNAPGRSEHSTASLRTGIMSGAPCPLPLMRQVVAEMGAREICIGYGQTEASPIITLTSVDDPLEVRVGTVGRPIPGIEVKLVGPGGDACDPGELCVRGHVVMKGYYKNPDATAKAIDAEGWLHTGDMATRRPDGNYRIVGRLKELIIRGGENIHPPEVEEFLHHHPAVAEVAVVGLPDPVYGEVVSAWVVLKEGRAICADDLRDFCREQIARYKVPQYVEFVEQLPRTVTGKVRKHILRERGIERFNLGAAAETETA